MTDDRPASDARIATGRAAAETEPSRRAIVLAGLRGYKPQWIKSDVSAGLAIAAVALPSAVAYPAIAGLPPETGLYASIFSLVMIDIEYVSKPYWCHGMRTRLSLPTAFSQNGWPVV